MDVSLSVPLCADRAAVALVRVAAGPASPEAAHALQTATDAFCAASEFGYFSWAPSSTDAHCQETAVHTGMGEWAREWRITGIQGSAFLVLLRMLQGCGKATGGIENLALKASCPGHPAQDIVTRAADLQFPMVLQQSPFPCSLRVVAAPWIEAVVRISFASEINDQQFDIVRRGLRAWNGLVVFGGFFEDAQIIETPAEFEPAIDESQTYRSAPMQIEHLLYEPIGSVSALHVLVNYAQWVDRAVAPVASLEIE